MGLMVKAQWCMKQAQRRIPGRSGIVIDCMRHFLCGGFVIRCRGFETGGSSDWGMHNGGCEPMLAARASALEARKPVPLA